MQTIFFLYSRRQRRRRFSIKTNDGYRIIIIIIIMTLCVYAGRLDAWKRKTPLILIIVLIIITAPNVYLCVAILCVPATLYGVYLVYNNNDYKR